MAINRGNYSRQVGFPQVEEGVFGLPRACDLPASGDPVTILLGLYGGSEAFCSRPADGTATAGATPGRPPEARGRTRVSVILTGPAPRSGGAGPWRPGLQGPACWILVRGSWHPRGTAATRRRPGPRGRSPRSGPA